MLLDDIQKELFKVESLLELCQDLVTAYYSKQPVHEHIYAIKKQIEMMREVKQ